MGLAGVNIVSDERVVRFVSDHLGAYVPPYVALGTERDGKIVNGVILNVFEQNSVHVSAAGTGWTRQFITSLGDYVYRRLGYGRMTVVTENEDVVEYAKRLGGQVEGVMRNHFGDGRNATVVGLLREDFRYVTRDR